MTKKTFIFGLGNPGESYEKSRHNVGYQFLDYLRLKLDLESFSKKKKLQSLVSANNQLILVKPQTYMNSSGEALSKTLEFFLDENIVTTTKNDLFLKKLFIVHDDLDLELGSFKIQYAIGPKQHNGLLSIYQHLKTSSFWHVRVGIDSRGGDRTISPDKYVLQNFTSEEQVKIQSVFAQVLQKLSRISNLATQQ
ncbi:MAG: Peptidyl-tRNA hydrolase [Microgenomates bacterium 39_7]|nr:MAG: Peptidyl-tRNA hydrolase [Microgenomates bacterium 39_7]